ncbi:hypothetical protein [Roseobacter phage RDJL6]|nr:hypothetical protein [Roseobacter phage RDJL6]
MQIWKFPIAHERHQMVVMPRGAVLLDLQSQKGVLTLWACVDPEKPKVQRDLSIIGTGHDLPGGKQAYIATAQQGSLVWHLFDGGEV